eukprot:869215-Pyramimonas_sp.AAC.1
MPVMAATRVHERAHVWKWLPWPVSEHLLDPHATDHAFTIAVAGMSEPMRADGYVNMVSLSQVFKLCPIKRPLVKILSAGSSVWTTCYDLDIPEAHFCRSAKSAAVLDWAAGRRGDVLMVCDERQSLPFTSYMGTALFVLALLVSVVSTNNQAGPHLQWAFMVLSHCLGLITSPFVVECVGVRCRVVG